MKLLLWTLFGLLMLTLPACAPGSAEQGATTGAECDPYLRYLPDIAPLMDAYCVKCHAESLALSQRHGAPGNHNFDSEQGLLDNAEHVELVAAVGPLAANRTMPPAGNPKPSDAERRLLGQWLACQNDEQYAGHVH